MTDELAVEATGLTKSYRATPVLRGIDLSVPCGTVFALLGPNGAGKTTTVRILATLLRADGGQARVAGFDVVAQRHQARRAISLTGQYAAVDELQTGAENLRMMARLAGLPRAAARRRAVELLERFDLVKPANRRVASYSGGMRRRLDLAASLVAGPAVIFLDEPTTGLDPRSRQQMWAVIRELTGSGVTIFLTTQYLDEADELAAKVTVLDDGQVAAEGTPAQLKRQVGAERLDLVARTEAGYAALAHRLGGRATHADPAGLTLGLPTDGSAAHVRSLLDELDPDHQALATFAVRAPTLDDVFFALTGHGPRPAAPQPARGAQPGRDDRSARDDQPASKEHARV